MSSPSQAPNHNDTQPPQAEDTTGGAARHINSDTAPAPNGVEVETTQSTGSANFQNAADETAPLGSTLADDSLTSKPDVKLDRSRPKVDTASNEESTEEREAVRPPKDELKEDEQDPMERLTSKAEMGPSSTPPPQPSSRSLGKAPVRSPSPPPPPPKDERYLTSDQDGPSRGTSPVSQEHKHKSSGRNSEDAEAAEYAAKYDRDEDAADDERSEIQSIMEQFDTDAGGPGADEIMSPRLEIANTRLESPVTHPPRRSSLEPLNKPLPIPADGHSSEQPLHTPPPRRSSLYPVQSQTSLKEKAEELAPDSPSAHAPMYKPTPPLPQPDPEPDLPFDFHRFLDQLRHRTADPVAKYLRSFLIEFQKKQWMVHEQVKIIADFLDFISKKMAQCEVWRTVSDAEFDNAREGMEKLVMNRLYTQTFSPAIPAPDPVPNKGRRRNANDPLAPGRRGQHQEDVERDEVLAQKVRIYSWVREPHLDIQPVGEKGNKFLTLAQQELIKIKSYRAPRDKVICILNCCKVIFGFLRNSQSDQSADAFVPLLIYTVLQANPDHLVSNVQYILRFRNQDKLGGETGYYISSLMGAIQFIENLDRTSLTITDEEFEKNVEAAVSAIAERHTSSQSPLTPTDPSAPSSSRLQASTPNHRRMPSPHIHLSEKSAISRPEVTQRNSLEAERAGPRRSTSLKDRQSGETQEENAAVAGLLRTIQRPLSTIGRIFSDNDTPTASSAPSSHGATPRLSPAPPLPRRSSDYPGGQNPPQLSEKGRPASVETERRQRLSAEEAAARQASAEAEQARQIQQKEHQVVVETLKEMFPHLDREVIDDIVRVKEGRVGLAVDACLALSNS